MTLIGCWRFTGTPTQNGVVTVGSNETTPLRPLFSADSRSRACESRISENKAGVIDSSEVVESIVEGGPWSVVRGPQSVQY